MKINIKGIISWFGIAYLLATTLRFCMFFFMSWLNKSYKVTYLFNYYGEATIEVIIMFIFVPCSIYAAWRLINLEVEDGRQTNSN